MENLEAIMQAQGLRATDVAATLAADWLRSAERVRHLVEEAVAPSTGPTPGRARGSSGPQRGRGRLDDRGDW